MTAPRSLAQRRATAGLILTVLGLLAWALSRYVADHEAQAYTDGRPPPTTVTLAAGHTYWLAVPGGVQALVDADVAPSGLRCTASSTTSGTVTLSLVTQPDGTNAVNQFASFVSPRTGPMSVSCTGLAGVYVDGTTGDPSGWLLVAAVVLLTIGVPLVLSGMRSATLRVATSPAAGRPARQSPDDVVR